MAKWSDEKPWERRFDESAKAYEAFTIYLHMGASRSLAKVWQRLGKSKTQLERWSSRYDWRARVLKYENELRRDEFEKLKKERKKMLDRQKKIAGEFQHKALQALTSLDPNIMPPKEILSFFVKGAELEASIMEEQIKSSALESGSDGRKASLADEIIEAYRKRQEAEE